MKAQQLKIMQQFEIRVTAFKKFTENRNVFLITVTRYSKSLLQLGCEICEAENEQELAEKSYQTI